MKLSLRLSLLLLLPLCVGTLQATALDRHRLVRDARSQIGVTTSYDPAYRVLGFPMGDVDARTGVCTDVVVRAYRRQGIDLQALVNQDMRRAFAVKPPAGERIG